MNGQSAHKSYVGALLSILTLVIVTSYSIQRFIMLHEKIGTKHVSTTDSDVNRETVFSQGQTGINFAVGLYRKDSWNPVHIDTFGYLELEMQRFVWRPLDGATSFEFNLEVE